MNFYRRSPDIKKVCLVLSALLLSFSLWAHPAPDEIEVINIENPAVQAYMADSTYFYDNDWSKSVITLYNNTGKYGSKLYWPGGKEVTWTPTAQPADIAEIRVTLSYNPDYSYNIVYHPEQVSASSYVIRNCYPNCTHYYKVEEILKNGTVTRVASGAFRTVGQVRMMQVLNCKNVRDMGGWPTSFGVPVNYGLLYRSANLDMITAKGRHDFAEVMGVGAELDLRHEVKLTKSKLGQGKDYLRLKHTAGINGLKSHNDVFVTDLKWIIARLREGKSVDWHCAIGCDRCGTVSFLIAGLLGVDEVGLSRDYELSSLSYSKKFKRVRGHLKGMINYIRTFGDTGDNLQQCFYKYWLKIGMSAEQLDYFIGVMIDLPKK